MTQLSVHLGVLRNSARNDIFKAWTDVLGKIYFNMCYRSRGGLVQITENCIALNNMLNIAWVICCDTQHWKHGNAGLEKHGNAGLEKHEIHSLLTQ